MIGRQDERRRERERSGKGGGRITGPHILYLPSQVPA